MTNLPMALCLLGLGCSACFSASAPVSSSPSNNSNIEVETLFTHDGCTVFRFFDAGYHYYARCDGAHATISTVSCGRHCTRQEEVRTVAGESAASLRASYCGRTELIAAPAITADLRAAKVGEASHAVAIYDQSQTSDC